MSSFFEGKCFAKLFSNYILALKFFGKKAAQKMSMKLTTGGNFANI